jgi:hypothetical protein
MQVQSSKAFLGRGFRDIEMLLEAGFRELEDQRSTYMVQRRKKLRQKLEKARAHREQMVGGAGQASLVTKAQAGGGQGDGRRDGRQSPSVAVEEDDDPTDEDDEDDDDEDDESFNSEGLASMDFDELKARLAATDAKERRAAQRDGKDAAAVAEAEAADVRMTEYQSLEQSKMGKQQQKEELQLRVEKEQAAALAMKERLEGAIADEQAVMAEWERLDSQLQAAELDRATVTAAKLKAKELALEKAQVRAPDDS